MVGRAWVICVLLALACSFAAAQSDDDKLVRDWAKKLARERDPKDRAKLNARNWAGLTALESGIVTGNAGVEELIAAGARLDPAKARSWAEAYKTNPRALTLVKKASTP